jgi:hypothetical protein
MGLGLVSNIADVGGVLATSGQMHVQPETNAAANPNNVGAVKTYSANDDGYYTGVAYLQSPECDDDFRSRSASDIIFDTETFNYTAQNTGKHTYANSTMTIAWGTNGMSTNSGSVNTTGIGLTFGTYAEFPVVGSNSLYCEMEGGFTAQAATNVYIDFGLFRRGASVAYAPTDGAYFRLAPAGLQAVINYNGVETQGNIVTPFVFNINQKYRFIITCTQREIEFWIDDQLFANIEVPIGQGQAFMSGTLPFSIRHAHVGTAGAIVQFVLNNYTVSLGGSLFAEKLSDRANAVYGSYQGLSGGTMGALMSGTVTTGTLVFPSAAVPSNTALTANLCNNLAGRSAETFTSGLALATDGILQQYQVPAGGVSVLGKRLRVTGLKLSAWVSTVMAGGTAIINEFKIAYGHTATSLQTSEAATTKKPRYVMCPSLTQVVALTQAVTTQIAQPFGATERFDNPIYVNPGEFITLVITHQGTTLPTSGVICYNIQYDYSWE